MKSVDIRGTSMDVSMSNHAEQPQDSLKIPIKCEIESSFEELFHDILEMDGLSQVNIIESLSVEQNQKQIFRAGEGSGASGSFFFFSYD